MTSRKFTVRLTADELSNVQCALEFYLEEGIGDNEEDATEVRESIESALDAVIDTASDMLRR